MTDQKANNKVAIMIGLFVFFGDCVEIKSSVSII